MTAIRKILFFPKKPDIKKKTAMNNIVPYKKLHIYNDGVFIYFVAVIINYWRK